VTNTPEYRLEDQIGFKLRLANQKHLEIFSRLMPDLTPRQFAVLAKLLEVGCVSQNHLGRLISMDAATTNGVVSRLIAKGLIVATRSPTDKRRIEISLTESGQALSSASTAIAAKISGTTTQNLTQREARRLLDLLDRL
jgi:DNA-binding MarR family transcriptional regulator